jgi:hypothetical protein
MAFLDVRRTPPVVSGCAILSDNEATLVIDTTKLCAVRVGYACRTTYEEARLELEQQVARSEAWAWVRPLLGRVGQ